MVFRHDTSQNRSRLSTTTRKTNRIDEHKLNVEIKIVGSKLTLVPYLMACNLVFCNVFENLSECPKFSVKNIGDIL